MGRNSTNNDNSAVGAEFASVVSPNGFSTGDLVYRSPNGYGVMPTGAVTSGSIQLSPSPIDSQTLERSGNIGTHADLGGNGVATTAAKLSNGNIVVVYSRYGTLYFKIFDSNNNVVVAETSLGGHNSGFVLVAVVAFTGGFATWYSNPSNQFSNRAFTNAGVASYAAVSTGITIDSTLNNQFIYLIPRPDNRYVVVYNNSSPNTQVAVYNSTDGTAYSAATTIAASASRVTGCGAVVFSDNSFVVYTSSSTTFNWYRRSATGAAVTNNTFSIGSQTGVQMALLNNGNAAIYYKNTSNFLCYRSFTTSTNTFGSEVTLINVNLTGTSPVNAYTVPGTNTNIVFFATSSAGLWNPYEALNYIVVDGSTGTISLGGTNPLTVLGMSAFVFNNYMTFVDLGTKLRAYMNTTGAIVSASSSYTGGSLIYIELDTSTFAPINFTSLSNSYSSASGVPAGAYDRSNSLPASAYFVASVNSNPTGSSPTRQTTVLLSQTVVSSTVATGGFRLLQLSTGNILAAWVTNAGAVFFKVYTPSFVEIANVTVATSQSVYGVAVSEFPDGKIVVAYVNGSGYIDYKVFSSSFIEIQGTTTLVAANVATQPWDMCALNTSTNRLVGVYRAAAGAGEWIVRNQAGTFITNSSYGSATQYSAIVNPIDNGGFVINYSYASSWVGITSWVPNGNFTSWSALSISTSSGFTPNTAGLATYAMKAASVTPTGTNVYMWNTGTGAFWVGISGTTVNASSTTNSNVGTANSTTNGGGWAGLATNSEGWFAAIYANATVSSPSFMITGQATSSGLPQTIAQFSTSAFLPSVYSNPNLMMNTICPLYGSYFVVGQLNASGYPTIAAVSAYNRSYPAAAVAGTTPVGPATIDPSTGFSLIGVAASDCAAGGAGQVQTKGTAVLSSSYPTTSQTFDFTNPVTYGVKGSVSNRVITMED